MAEDSCHKASEESIATEVSIAVRQRKKRKWDQPAESLISAGLAVPGVLPMSNVGSFLGITLPGVAHISGASLTNPVAATCAAISQVIQGPLGQQNMNTVVQKLNQPKIQDEVIAREIVINDAESTIRYKLTKRQTQEEIQRCTGAVVITRGKYHPPNAPPDGERPLYLHISAGAHLKETAERIKAVDHAAIMVEEMLKQGYFSQPNSAPLSAISTGVQVPQLFTACVFLGFDPDPSMNIVACIRGPNDQYINHIMNETGATVLLRGKGIENFEGPHGEELQQPLHLQLSCSNPKSLEDAKILAENLLDTIAAECGASRISPSKAYNAVPPPQKLLAGVQSSVNEIQVNTGTIAGLTSLTMGSAPVPPISSLPNPGFSDTLPRGTHQSNMSYNSQPSVSGGTCYSGYGGIYPRATPLQQVALVLKQSPSPVNSTHLANATEKMPEATSKSNSEKEKCPPQKRKFQELPVTFKGSAKSLQVFSLTFYEADRQLQDLSVGTLNSLLGLEFLKPGPLLEDSSLKSISTMPSPKKLVRLSSNAMPPPPPPPPRMNPPSPPPKFTSSLLLSKDNGQDSVTKSSFDSLPHKSTSESVPETLIKLMEYGEEDDDDDDTEEADEVLPESNSKLKVNPKPFWAL